MYTFSYGYRCARLSKIEVKVCRLTWFKRRIIGQLVSLAENENVFATTRANARAMRFAVEYGFKPAGKPYPSGRGYDLVLYLRNAEETKQDVFSDGEIPG